MTPRRLGLVCPPVSGHLNPALTLGRELVERGHEVTLYGFPDAGPKARAAGVHFEPVAEDEMPPGSVALRMQQHSALSGFAALRSITRLIQQENLAYVRDFPRPLKRGRADGLILDQLAHGGVCVAERLQLPYVTMCNALALHEDLRLPPFAQSWTYNPSWLGLARNALGHLPLLLTSRAYFRPFNELRRAWQLPEFGRRNTGESRLAQVSQQPAAFEFPDRRLPACFHFTGPWHRSANRPASPFPWERLDRRPLVYASLGTLQNGILDLYRLIAAACDGLGLQLVLALGSPEAEVPTDLPGDPLVVAFAPQLELLPRAALVITHAGLNTVLEGLSCGVPMVALPIANDQPGVAARLRHLGAGDLIPLNRLTVRRLRETVRRVLKQPCYRDAARRLQREMAAVDGVKRAADVIEEALATGQPVLRRVREPAAA